MPNASPGSPGEPIAVVDSSGEVVASAETGGEGSAYFPNLPPGTYELEAGSVCALFANGVDARGGFTVSGGDSVSVEAFGCAAPAPVDPPPGGGWNGGGGDGTNGNGMGDGSGGDSAADQQWSCRRWVTALSTVCRSVLDSDCGSGQHCSEFLAVVRRYAPATGERAPSPGLIPVAMLDLVWRSLLSGSLIVRRRSYVRVLSGPHEPGAGVGGFVSMIVGGSLDPGRGTMRAARRDSVGMTP